MSAVEGIEVREATAQEWIEACIGPVDLIKPRTTAPHSRGEKVVQLKGPVPDFWALAA